jgi:hypothetical protein
MDKGKSRRRIKGNEKKQKDAKRNKNKKRQNKTR